SGQGKGDEVDAEMLRDLEVLNNPNYARDQEIGKRLTFYERMRMLDRWRSNRPAPQNDPNAPAAPAKREGRGRADVAFAELALRPRPGHGTRPAAPPPR